MLRHLRRSGCKLLLPWVCTLALSTSWAAGALNLSVDAIDGDGLLLGAYTCQGVNISPPMNWTGIPKEAKSLAIIAEDLDSSGAVKAHWILYNIPATVIEIPRGFNPSPETGMQFGVNYRNYQTYLGPCPDSGTHRYVFTLLALNDVVPANKKLDRDQFWALVQGYVIDYDAQMALYHKR